MCLSDDVELRPGVHWKRLIEGRNSGTLPLSSQCNHSLYDVIDLAPVMASSIRKTFTSRLIFG